MSEENNAPPVEKPDGNDIPAPDVSAGSHNLTPPAGEQPPADKFYIPPEENADEWNQLYQRLGRPEAPDKYKIDFREIDKPFASTMQKAFFDNGLPQKTAANLVNAWVEMQNAQAEQWTEQSKQEMQAWENAQGADLAKNQELARRGSTMLGLEADQVSQMETAIGTKTFMDLCLKLGNAIGEDSAKGLSGSRATQSEAISTEEFYRRLFNERNE